MSVDWRRGAEASSSLKSDSSLLSIRGFFAGKNVLLTGSTGFLAKAAVEKLLRDLPAIGRIFLLIRPKHKPSGAIIDPRERLYDEVLRNSAFGRLREQLGEGFDAFCEEKITCVNGDLTREKLGLNDHDYLELARQVDVIINSAATVVFDERLDIALNLNTLGPSRLLELAKAANSIYVQVSTAYVCGKRTGPIPDRLLSPLEAIDAQLPLRTPRPERFDVREEIEFLRRRAEEVRKSCLEELARKKIDPAGEEGRALLQEKLVAAGMERAHHFGWNDTYTFTKWLGEQLIGLERGKVPTVIVRPSIIESSLREPEPGWLDGLRMADPIIIGYGKGRLRDFPANPNVVIDIIPADYVVNAILAAAAHIASHPGGFDLFTVASSTKNPLLIQTMYEHVRDYFLRHPFTDKTGRLIHVPQWKFPTMKEYRRKMENRFLRPSRLANAIVSGPIPFPGTRKLRTRIRTQINTIEQLLYYVDIYGPYVNLDCRFQTERSFELLQSIDPEERELFSFDPRRFHWRTYFQDVHIPGLKRNILRMDAVPRAGAGQGHLLDEEAKRNGMGGLSSFRGVPQTIVELALRARERHGERTFLAIRRTQPDAPSGNTLYTFAEFFERAGLVGQKLSDKLGLHPGDRIALLGENSPEWQLAYLAISRAGAAAVPFDRTLPSRELVRLLKMVEAKAILVSPSLWKGLVETWGGGGLPPAINFLGDFEPHPGQKWPQPHWKERLIKAPAPEALASILFTSGTTFDPKGVMLSHSNFISNVLAGAEVLEPMPSDRFLSVLPLHHAFEFTCGFLCPMFGGCEVHHIETLKAQEVLETMRLSRTTAMLGVPRLFKLLMDGIQSRLKAAGKRGELMVAVGTRASSLAEMLGHQKARKQIFSKVHEAFGGHLRLFISGGAALDPQIFHFFKKFGIKICEGYGLTETSPVLTVNPMAAPKAGSVGLPVPGVEIRIQPLDGADAGEIWARGPAIMHGYWKNPEATARVFENGWFKTGDLGRIESDGYLQITGRLKDVIVTSAGKKVHPDDLEHALGEIPGVKEFCVVGLPDRSGMGEEVAAVLVPEDPARRNEIESFIQQTNRQFASHQRISRLEFQTEELPKTSTLKIQRAKVRQQYSSPVSPGEASQHEAPAWRKETTGSRSTLQEVVACAVSKVAPHILPEDVQPNMKLQMDLGIDSIGRVDLLNHLETQLNLSFPPESESKLYSVRDLVLLAEEAGKSLSARTSRKSARTLWERVQVRQEMVEKALRQTVARKCLRGTFDLVSSGILASYMRVRATGVENVPKKGAYILAANHCSHLDSPAIRKALGGKAARLHVMAAKDYFFDTSFKRWFFSTFLNALPLDREDNPSESLGICKIALERGCGLLIFPEGTRSLTGELQPFKPGIGVLALELNYPIIPVYVHGSFHALPKGRTLPASGRISVHFGPAADFNSLKAQKGTAPLPDLYRRAAAELRAKVEALSERFALDLNP